MNSPAGADHEAVRRARVVLSRVGEPGDPRLGRLIDELGPVRVLDELRDRGRHGALQEGLADRLATADGDAAERELAAAASRGIRFLTPEDDEWPESLADLAHVSPLHERGGVPVGLWVRGTRRLDESVSGAVAVVGSRSATSYGTSIAGEIGAAAVDGGHGVISGAAFGIDQAAHRGALAAGGPTVAVLACGVDRAYPTAHRELLAYIADRGLIISEAAPGCSPTRVRFLARNRLIATLSVGTVVVEAAIRSGALNTAHWAAGLSRVLMGVPGPVVSAQSEGVHRLIRTRDALLVTSGAEVLEAIGGSGQHLGTGRSAPSGPRDQLTLEQKLVLEAVPLRCAAPARSIGRAAGVATTRVVDVLGELGRAGLVERQDGRWRQVVDEEVLLPGRASS